MTSRSVLMIAYHFPPLAGSSGIQRTLRFVQHLPAFGWRPIVLTASPRAYERTSDDLLADVPAGTPVIRAFALDTARHLAVGGRYVGAMARPDRWVSWRYDGVRQALRAIREHRPAAIWSTYPIATAHLIGAAAQRRSGLPWIADFRDPMAQDGYPADPVTWRQFSDIESRALRSAAASTFTTPGAARVYRERYPEAAGRITVLENGYDEESFAGHADAAATAAPLRPGAKVLLHSGIVYPSERDPSALMAALRLLADHGTIRPGDLEVRFRAAVAEDLVRDLARRHGVEAYVALCPPLPYRDALSEMLRADGLLVLQASNCNEQVPAKLYEYFRAGRPIVALTDPAGDTATVLGATGVGRVARLDEAAGIAAMLESWLGDGAAVLVPDPVRVARTSRRQRAGELAALLDRVAGG